jgi:hypothetical protein
MSTNIFTVFALKSLALLRCHSPALMAPCWGISPTHGRTSPARFSDEGLFRPALGKRRFIAKRRAFEPSPLSLLGGEGWVRGCPGCLVPSELAECRERKVLERRQLHGIHQDGEAW